MEGAAIPRGADVDGDEHVGFGVWRRDAASKKIGAGPANGVLDDVGKNRGQGYADCKGEVGCLVLGGRGLDYEVVCDEDTERDEEGVDKVHG